MTQPPKPSVRGNVARLVREHTRSWTDVPTIDQLNNLLRQMAKWRGYVLAETYLAYAGPIIMQGPFAGMTYISAATEGALVPRLLGVYESELHPHIEAFAAEGLDCVIDVGCAEGYYAVGLARRMPETEIHAFDTDPNARTACAELASRNGVADRVRIGGEFKPEDFQAFAGRRVLVVVDTEGAEVDNLQPDRAPALAEMNIIVETHDLYRAGAMKAMLDRFGDTHDIVRLDQTGKAIEMPAWLKELGHLDQLLAVWEWRQRPTPWLVMRPKSR